MVKGKVKIGGKDYSTVALRIATFRHDHPDWSLTSEIVINDEQFILMKALVRDENDRLIATGFAEEKRGATQINRTSALENCETSARGRALQAMGYDGGDCSADELANALHQQNNNDGVATEAAKPANLAAQSAKLAKAQDALRDAPDLDTLSKWEGAVADKFNGDAKAIHILSAVANLRYRTLLLAACETMSLEKCLEWEKWVSNRGFLKPDSEAMLSALSMRIGALEQSMSEGASP